MLCLNNHMMHVCLARTRVVWLPSNGKVARQTPLRLKTNPSCTTTSALTHTHTQLATPFDPSTACSVACLPLSVYAQNTHYSFVSNSTATAVELVIVSTQLQTF